MARAGDPYGAIQVSYFYRDDRGTLRTKSSGPEDLWLPLSILPQIPERLKKETDAEKN
jgi:hypothetical protein